MVVTGQLIGQEGLHHLWSLIGTKVPQWSADWDRGVACWMMSWQPWNLGENCVIKVLQQLCREELLQACEQYQFRHDATRFLSENLLLSAARPSEARNVGRRLVSWYRIVSFFSK